MEDIMELWRILWIIKKSASIPVNHVQCGLQRYYGAMEDQVHLILNYL
jgi:hypothetical protein